MISRFPDPPLKRFVKAFEPVALMLMSLFCTVEVLYTVTFFTPVNAIVDVTPKEVLDIDDRSTIVAPLAGSVPVIFMAPFISKFPLPYVYALLAVNDSLLDRVVPDLVSVKLKAVFTSELAVTVIVT